MPGNPEAITREQRIVLVIIAFAAFMGNLDSTIVTISLPTIASSFHSDLSDVSWVVLAYLLVLAGFLLSAGRLADLHGFRRVFIAGFAVFTLGSLLCGLSGNITELVGSRVLQGIGGAALEALAPAMILHYLPEHRRGWAIGVLATVISLGIAAGPILGGFITEFLSWHWIFLLNVPVGIIALLLSLRYLPADLPPASKAPFDTAGTLLILPALTTLLFPISQGLDLGWTSPVILGSFLVSLILWFLFFYHERRCEAPLVDLRLFSSKNYLLGNTVGLMIVGVFAGLMFLLPFFFENVQGRSTEFVGLLLAIPSVALMLAGPVSGTLSDRYGTRLPTAGAVLVTAAAFFLFSLFTATTGLPLVIGAMILLGASIGIFFPPNISQILGSGPRGCEGGASGVMMTLRYAGAMVGIALFGTIVSQAAGSTMAGDNVLTASPAILSSGFTAAFSAGLLICLAGAFVAAAIRDERAPSAKRS
jgi:EmrB/QacA subfamily drug resistance transporter